MSTADGRCAFCGAAAALVEVPVLDEKWSRRFGGDLVIALDHGWYRDTSGRSVPVERPGGAKFFRPYARGVCDPCAHGWLEDLTWRAEPAVLSLAEAGPPPTRPDVASVVRWLRTVAVLTELVPGLPRASTAAYRHALRTGGSGDLPGGVWMFALRQRLPARAHLSQVAVPGGGGLVQVVSLDVARWTALVVLPSDDAAADLLARSALEAEFGAPRRPDDGRGLEARVLDLALTPAPHRVAVGRLCRGVPPD